MKNTDLGYIMEPQSNNNMHDERRVFVPLASKDLTPEVLKSIFRDYNCIYVQHKGTYAFVDFSSKSCAESAIKDINDKPPWMLKLSLARKKSYYDSNDTSSSNNSVKSNQSSGNKPRYDASRRSSSGRPNSKFGNKSNDEAVETSSGYSDVKSMSSPGYEPVNKKFNKDRDGQHTSKSNVPAANTTSSVSSEDKSVVALFQSSGLSFKQFIVQTTKELQKYDKKYTDKDDLGEEIGKLLDSMVIVPPNVPGNRSNRAEVKTPSYSKNEEINNVKPKTDSPNSTITTHNSAKVVTSRTFNAWLSTPGKSMSLQIVKKCKESIICLAMDVTDDTMRQKYESLFEEFANCCDSIKGNETPVPDTIMAVEASKGVWYRALQCAEGWALLDEGSITPVEQVSRVIRCPEKYRNIPEFACCFVCDPVSLMEKVDTSLVYSVEFVSKTEEDRTLRVKVRSSDNLVELDGTIKQWKLPPVECKKEVLNQQAKGVKKPEFQNRISIIDNVKVGDKLAIAVTTSDSLGQMCVMCNDSDPSMAKQYESLMQELADTCEAEKPSSVVSGRVMAVRLTSDQAWYRCVSVHGGLALVDDGRTVTREDVDKCVLCPKQYDKVQEFCVLLTNVVPLKQNKYYISEIISKSGNKANVEITSKDDQSILYNGCISPFAEFREESSVARLIEERVSNSVVLNTLKVSSLSKLKIQTGSEVLLVNHYKENFFLRLNNEEAKKIYFQLLDNLTLSGPKLSAVSNDLEKDDLVICKYDEQYHRAVIEQIHPNTNECILHFMDIGHKSTVSYNLLKAVPVWAAEAPIMTDCFTLSDVDKNIMCSAATTMYLVSLIDKQTPLKCQSLNVNQVVLQMADGKQTINEHILDINTPNWKKIIQRDGVLREPVLMEQDMSYFDVKVGQKLKIIHKLEKAFSVCVPEKQMESKLEELTKNFSAYCNAVNDSYLPRLEELCLYKDKQSGTWRRGCALHIDDRDIVSVSSLDHGDATKVHFSDCRKMLAEFCTPLPFLAVYVTIADIGPDPSDSTFDKTYEVMKKMDALIVEAVKCVSLGIYDVKVRGLSAALRDQEII